MAMRELLAIRSVEQARVLLNPIRIKLVELLREPRTCAELASALDLTPQRINNHLKALRDAGLVRIASRRQVRNLVEATYQAEGKAYWLSPRIVREDPPTDRALRDELSLHNLLVTAEEIQEDVAELLSRTDDEEVPSLGLSIEITLGSAESRNAFTREVLEALRPVVERYQEPQSNEGRGYKLQLLCYPEPNPTKDE